MCLCHLADPSSQIRHSCLPSLPQRPPSPPRLPAVSWPENLILLLKTSPAKECFLGVRTGAPPAAPTDLSLRTTPTGVAWSHPELGEGRATLHVDCRGLHGASDRSETRADI